MGFGDQKLIEEQKRLAKIEKAEKEHKPVLYKVVGERQVSVKTELTIKARSEEEAEDLFFKEIKNYDLNQFDYCPGNEDIEIESIEALQAIEEPDDKTLNLFNTKSS